MVQCVVPTGQNIFNIVCEVGYIFAVPSLDSITLYVPFIPYNCGYYGT